MSAPSPAMMPRTLPSTRPGTAYDTLLRSQQEGSWLPEVETQLERWLVTKKNRWRVPLAEGGEWSRGRQTLRVRHLDQDAVKALRFEMREETNTGIWTTRLLAVDKPTGGWISVSIANDRGEFAAVPGIARYLLNHLSLRDGGADYRDMLWHVGVDDVDALMDVMLDPQRRSPVFVAAGDPSHSPKATWAQFSQWFRQTYGVGHAVLLEPEALAAFNARMLPGGGVEPLTIRTYLRGVDKDDRDSISRHLVLGTKRLVRMGTRDVAELLGRIAREQTTRRVDHDEVVSWERRFTASANQALTAVKPAPAIPRPPRREDAPAAQPATQPTAPEATTPTAHPADADAAAQLAQVLAIFGLEEVDLTVLELMTDEVREADDMRDQIREAGERIEALQTENNALVDERDDLEDFVEVLNSEAKDNGEEINTLKSDAMGMHAEIGRLHALLAAANAADPAGEAATTEQRPRPSSYTELLDAVATLESSGVVFTGDDAETLSLATLDTQGKCISKAWDACLTLRDYVRAKADGAVDQSVAWYLANTPAGYRSFPTTQHAHTETGETKKKHGDERILPVPVDVDPSGEVLMLEHFKLGKLHHRDPRLYYRDDTTRTGKVYIGYIGTHLTNTHT